MKNIILIPARRNSKGVPFKNRKLFSHTTQDIPEDVWESVYVSTDDEEIKHQAAKQFNIHDRSKQNSSDKSSTLSLVKEFIADKKIKHDNTITILYLTYPERTFAEVDKIHDFFVSNNLKSLLCKKEVKTNPFLCMYEVGNGKGKQIIEHHLYRRQDYPKVFELSHYVSIFKVSEIDKLNNNMYNEETYFYSIDDKIDIDEQKDLERFLDNGKH